MSAPLTYEVVAGRARWGGRTLAEWVPEAVERLVEHFNPVGIVLFGSVARGDDGPDSDIDLLVVFDHIEGSRHDLGVDAARALSEIGAPVDVLVADPDRLQREGDLPGVLRVALREGKVVYER